MIYSKVFFQHIKALFTVTSLPDNADKLSRWLRLQKEAWISVDSSDVFPVSCFRSIEDTT